MLDSILDNSNCISVHVNEKQLHNATGLAQARDDTLFIFEFLINLSRAGQGLPRALI